MTDFERLINEMTNGNPNPLFDELFEPFLSTNSPILEQYRKQRKHIVYLEKELEYLRAQLKSQDEELKHVRELNAILTDKLQSLDTNEKYEDLKKKYDELLIDYRRLSRKDQIKSELPKKYNDLLKEYKALIQESKRMVEREQVIIEEKENWEFTADAYREDFDNAVSEKNYIASKYNELEELSKKQAEEIEKQTATMAAAAKHIRNLEKQIEKYKELEQLYDKMIESYTGIKNNK